MTGSKRHASKLDSVERTAEEPDYPYDMIKIEVRGNVSDALRARLDEGKSTIEYYSHIDGYTR